MFGDDWLQFLQDNGGMGPMQPLGGGMPPGVSVQQPPASPFSPQDFNQFMDSYQPQQPASPYADPTQPEQEAYNNPWDKKAMALGSMGGSGDGLLGGLFGGGDSQPTGGKDWGSMLMALGGGIAGGATQGWGAGIGAGFQGAAAANMRSKENAREDAYRQQALAMRQAELAKADIPKSVQEYQYAKENGFQGGYEDFLTLSERGSTQYGSPLTGRDAEGNNYVGALQKGGGVIWYGQDGKPVSDKNIQYQPGVQWQDFDTYRQPFDKSGNPAAPPIQRNRAEAAGQDVAGKGQGEALEAYRSMSSKLPGLQSVVSKLDTLAETATYTTAGKAYDTVRKEFGLDPRKQAVDRTEYKAIVDNQILPLLRDTFGAQFTVQEGETLRSTLGDPDKTPAEKQKVLKAFIEQKVRDITALASRTGQPAPAGGGAPAGGDPLGIR